MTKRKHEPVLKGGLTKTQVAEVLGCGLTKVDELIGDGSLTAYKLGTGPRAGVRIDRQSVEDFRNRNAVKAKANRTASTRAAAR